LGLAFETVKTDIDYILQNKDRKIYRKMAGFDVNMFTTPFQLTKSMHRELYPALEPTNADLNASGKTVLITGASGTLGIEIAEAWSIAGADGIILTGRNTEILNATAERVRKANGNVKILVHSADTTNESHVKELYEAVGKVFNKVDVLINSQGTMNHEGNIGVSDTKTWWKDFETNVKGPYLMIDSFVKKFNGEGTIINLSTMALAVSAPGITSYGSSKLAILKATELLQLEYPNLRTFSLAPGNVKSNMTHPAFGPFAIDDGRLTGGLSLYLSTPKADYLKGGLCSVNWDVREMEAHKKEITEKGLVKLAFLNAKLGPEGHSWEA